ncbi:MAG: leucine-rich repeat protein [Paludibacter sp.]
MKKIDPLYILIAIGMIFSIVANAQSVLHADPAKYTKNLKLPDHFYLNSAGMVIGSVEYESVAKSRPARVSALKNDTSIYLSAGELSVMLTPSQRASITGLQLTGNIDARDFKTMRDSMPVLSAIDINSVSVVAYTGTMGTAGSQNISYPANGIPQNAFSPGNNNFNFKLNSIVLPASVTSIGDSAFYKCANLTGNLVIPSFVSSIGNNAFELCGNLNGTLVLPNSVTTIGVKAFSQCQNLIGLTLSESLTSISDGAFDGDWLLQGHLNIPASVTSIGDYAFYYSSFTGVTIPNSVTTIGVGAFGKSKMLSDNVIIPNSITKINDFTFASCARLTSITLPNSITSIGNNVFLMSGLTGITLPNSIISIGDWAFSFSNLTGNVAIPPSLARIGHGTFSPTGITDFVVANDNPHFSAINGILFDKTANTLIAYISGRHGTYAIPDATTSIGNYAFDYCNALTDVIIPSSVVSIGDGAFYSCSALSTLTVKSSTPIALSGSTSVFGDNVKANTVLYIPAGSMTLYEAANQWTDFVNMVEMLPTGNDVELAGNDHLILYPNPTSEGFYINAGEDKWSTISIYNLTGMRSQVSVIKGKSYIDISSLVPGHYIVKILSPNGTVEKKLLKN